MRHINYARISATCSVLAVILITMSAATGPIFAASGDAAPLPNSILYDGQTLDTAPFAATSWGAGTVEIVDYPGASASGKVLQIDSFGPFQGALLTFNPPGVLGDLHADRTRYLVLKVALAAPGADTQSELPGRSLFHLADLSTPNMPGGNRPGQTATKSKATVVKPIASLHLILTLSTGATVNTMRVLPPADPTTPWTNIGIPLGILPLTATQSQDAQLQSLMIAADKTGTFYVAQIKLVTDSTPITGYIEGSRDVDLNATQTYTVHATGGATNLSYTWKFGDDDSVSQGMTVSHHFTTAGDFKVSITVLNVNGIKTGIITTTTVHVSAP